MDMRDNNLVRSTFYFSDSKANITVMFPRNAGSRYKHRGIGLCDIYTLY